ncbi:hypothetical protein H5410_062537 [Solanum commersonii]|uniref:DUF7746 domain-containing protein n=1 Tax=Solanum commersonii TaxID=4109 RepID=A0A9J5WAM5_SOLCO|nr:hypothetical protein H5410_062537 [Solanum commersonii]
MYIGLVQVAFKPLTLRGLPESFIAALRYGRNHNWKKSLIGTIQTSLAYGPVYFNAYPNLQISLQDENSLSSLMLNLKLYSYDYMPSTEVVCICYRIYYKLLHTLNPMCKVIDFKNETILIETNFDKSKIPSRASTSQIKKTYRCDNIKIDKDNIVKPIRRASSDLDIIESEINFSDGITALLPTKVKGKEKVAHSSLQPPPDSENFKIKGYSDLEHFLEKKFKGGGVQPIDAENFIEGEPSNKKEFYDNLNKISEKYARKPVQRMFYYPRPTPQDVLLKEHEHIITNSYNGKEIYEWNIDGYTDRQIYTTVHRMLMYYKDVFLCRVMELPECNSTHWKSKFIDRLPTLFAERSKDLDSSHKTKKSSKKDYEKWKKKKIEKKFRRAEESRGDSSKRKKRYRQNFNKSDTFHKCGRYGHYAKDYRVREKIKNLDIEDNLKDSLYKIMLNSDSGTGTKYSSTNESSTSEDLKALQQEDYLTSEDECSPCQQGMVCEKDEEDDLYKIYEQFKKLSPNVIDNDKVIELLQTIKDPKIRAQIIDKISDSKEKDHIAEKDHIPKEIPTKEGSYTMAEVKNLLLERRKMTSSPTTISDLKEEINNLKEDIIRLKEKNVVIDVRLDAIQALQNLDNASESSSSLEGDNDSLDFIKNLRERGRSNSGRGGHILAQQGSRTLTSFNVSHSTVSSSGTSGIGINHPMYKEFMDFMNSKKESDNNPPSYSSILIDDESIEVFDMNDKKEVILLLEENDLKWRNEPWKIMARYLDTVSYTITVYKYRMHYEIILSTTKCEFQHFYPANTKKVYNFSKLIIKKIIAPEEWGMSTLKELDYIHPEQKKNPEGKLYGQEIIDLINVTISKYYDTTTTEPQAIEDISPFKKITRKLQMKKGLISKSEAIAIYMEEVKKDLMKNLDIDIKDDMSMVSASHTNEEEDACIAREGQDIDDEEIDLETILKRYQQQLEESSSASTTGKGKEKI